MNPYHILSYVNMPNQNEILKIMLTQTSDKIAEDIFLRGIVNEVLYWVNTHFKL